MNNNRRPHHYKNKKQNFSNNNNSSNNIPSKRTFQQMMKSWHELYNSYLKARSHYFLNFDFVDLRKLNQLEKDFFRAGENLRIFESKLTRPERAYMKSRLLEYPVDEEYSKEVLPQLGEESQEWDQPNQLMVDPHCLETQIQAKATFQNDKEESVGTIDDYVRLKGSKFSK